MKKNIMKTIGLLLAVSLLTACGNTAEPEEKDLVPANANAVDVALAEDAPVTSTTAPELYQTPAASKPAEETTAETAEPTAEPEETSVETAEPAATEKPTTETAAPAAPKTDAPAEAAPEYPQENLVLNPDAPAVVGVVEKTETVTRTITQEYLDEHQPPAGMPAVVYSEDDVWFYLMMYSTDPRDSYVDAGDGAWYYVWNGDMEVRTREELISETITTTNWYSGTEADASAKLAELRAMYPDGTHWGYDSYYDNPGSTLDTFISNNDACAGYAKLVSDYLFGYDAPAAKVAKYPENIKIGDIILTYDHAFVYTGGGVQEIETDWWKFNETDGNVLRTRTGERTVRWDDLEIIIGGSNGMLTVITRYPQ